jgi:hypothetical protein
MFITTPLVNYLHKTGKIDAAQRERLIQQDKQFGIVILGALLLLIASFYL